MDNITLSDLEVKSTLDNSDKILIRDSNNVDKVIQGSAVESRITGALANCQIINKSISNGTDLNTILESGIYIANYDNHCTNRPSGVIDSFEFYLEVLKGAGNNRIQRYTERGTGRIYIRSYDNIGSDQYGWREWQQLAQVGVGTVTLTSSVFSFSSDSYCYNQNGIAYVHIHGYFNSNYSANGVAITGLPIPKIQQDMAFNAIESGSNNFEYNLNTNGVIFCTSPKSVGTWINFFLNYPCV